MLRFRMRAGEAFPKSIPSISRCLYFQKSPTRGPWRRAIRRRRRSGWPMWGLKARWLVHCERPVMLKYNIFAWNFISTFGSNFFFNFRGSQNDSMCTKLHYTVRVLVLYVLTQGKDSVTVVGKSPRPNKKAL